MMTDLSMEPKKSGKLEPAQPEATCASFTMRDDQVDKMDECTGPMEVGDEKMLTVRIKCTGQQDDQYGKSKTYEVLEAGEASDAEDTAEPGETGETETETETEPPLKNPALRKVMKKMMGKKGM